MNRREGSEEGEEEENMRTETKERGRIVDKEGKTKGREGIEGKGKEWCLGRVGERTAGLRRKEERVREGRRKEMRKRREKNITESCMERRGREGRKEGWREGERRKGSVLEGRERRGGGNVYEQDEKKYIGRTRWEGYGREGKGN